MTSEKNYVHVQPVFKSCKSSHLVLLPLYLHFFQVFVNFVGAEARPTNPASLLFEFPSLEAEKWELAKVYVRTPFRSRRDLEDREHHVLELVRPSQNTTIQIHLSKKPELVSANLRIVVQDGSEVGKEINPVDLGDPRDTIFAGKIITESNSSHQSAGGAALSVCGDRGGFCGLIVTDTEHLFIQPHLKSDNSSELTNNGAYHGVLSVDKSLRTNSCARGDGIRVPIEKLRAAAAASAASAHHTANDETPSDLGEVGSEVMLLPSLLAEVADNATDMSFAPTAYAGRGPRPAASTNRRKNVVEIAVFTDEDFYNQMRKKFPSDTLAKMKDYVITIINAFEMNSTLSQMDLMYQHPSLGEELEFSLVHLEIMKRYPAKLNKSNGRAMAYLSSFCDYAGEKNVNGMMWDHALLLTGMDLHEDDTTATAGLAWAGTMCYRYYSCSVSEGTSFGAAYIITHEIGHSLGMEHDGMGISKDCDKRKYLMSPTTGPGKIEWSPCSRQNLKDFLQYGTAELRDTRSAHKPTCLTVSSIQSSNRIAISEGNQMPGKKYNASTQCKLAMGSQFRPVLRKSEPPFDNICWMLYCGNGTHAVSTHPALEGTKCDDSKVCRSGKCVSK